MVGHPTQCGCVMGERGGRKVGKLILHERLEGTGLNCGLINVIHLGLLISPFPDTFPLSFSFSPLSPLTSSLPASLTSFIHCTFSTSCCSSLLVNFFFSLFSYLSSSQPPLYSSLFLSHHPPPLAFLVFTICTYLSSSLRPSYIFFCNF